MKDDPKKKHDFEKKWNEVIKKASVDQGFKQQLLKNPGQALKLHGVDVPSGVTVKIVEDSPTTLYLVLPHYSKHDLSEEQLREVAGGIEMPYAKPGFIDLDRE